MDALLATHGRARHRSPTCHSRQGPRSFNSGQVNNKLKSCTTPGSGSTEPLEHCVHSIEITSRIRKPAKHDNSDPLSSSKGPAHCGVGFGFGLTTEEVSSRVTSHRQSKDRPGPLSQRLIVYPHRLGPSGPVRKRTFAFATCHSMLFTLHSEPEWLQIQHYQLAPQVKPAL